MNSHSINSQSLDNIDGLSYLDDAQAETIQGGRQVLFPFLNENGEIEFVRGEFPANPIGIPPGGDPRPFLGGNNTFVPVPAADGGTVLVGGRQPLPTNNTFVPVPAADGGTVLVGGRQPLP